jgi:hypothetical protein
VLSDQTYVASQAGDDPITGGTADVLTGAAAIITVLAVKGADATKLGKHSCPTEDSRFGKNRPDAQLRGEI